MVEEFQRELEELIGLLREFSGQRGLEGVEEAGGLVSSCLKRGGKLLACGNGGSAANAQHLVAEMVVRFARERRGLAGISLTTDPSVITAGANDLGYTSVFSRQVEALGDPEDVLLAISTSGRSENVNRAVERARALGMKTVYLAGPTPPPVEADVLVLVPSDSTPRIQEVHGFIVHLLAEYIEKSLAE